MIASLLVLAGAMTALQAEAKAPQAREIKAGERTFIAPEGFIIEKVAGPPLVDRPITCDFDEQGALYVSDSSGSNENVQIQVKNPTHRILKLLDADGDGVFDQATVFADKMMFPEGTLWYRGSLYVSAPPSIWKLTDADGDGVAEKREEWFQGKTLTGCANDLHGPYLGPDGWIYWCKGAFAEQTYERPGKPPFKTRAAHIFRKRPEGTVIEPVMTGGMDNPVDVVFTPGGERMFTTTFLVHPGGGERDGIIHAIYGGVYGKVHDVLDGHIRTGSDTMPVMVHLGPAAPAGLVAYESKVFGSAYQHNLFACCFNLRKVTRHELKESGSTFAAETTDFVVSPDQDFHPTDVQEDADGSLLIVDTGGWYKLCCPTSQLVKPDVLGGIYRVRREGAARVEDPRGLKLKWTEASPEALADRLGDPRPAVHKRAIDALALRGDGALDALAKALLSDDAIARLNAVWTLTRIDAPRARALVRSALRDADANVEIAARHSISVWKDAEAKRLIEQSLAVDPPHVKRAGVEALGRIGDQQSIDRLFELVKSAPDRVLEHSITYAVIEIGDVKQIYSHAAPAGADSVRSLAYAAFDQLIPPYELGPAYATAAMSHGGEKLKKTVSWIASHRPDWADAIASKYLEEVDLARDPNRTKSEELIAASSRLLGSKVMREGLNERLVLKTPEAVLRTILEIVAASDDKALPNDLLASIAGIVGGVGESRVKNYAQPVTDALRGQKVADASLAVVQGALLRIARSSEVDERDRLKALLAVPGKVPAGAADLETFVIERLAPDASPPLRSLAADALVKMPLDRDRLLKLIGRLKDLGAIELARVLPAFVESHDEAVGLALVAALKTLPARSALRSEAIRPILEKYPDKVREAAKSLYELLDADRAGERARLETLLSSLGKGEIRAGQAVFNSAKANCKACHAIGYVGGKIGPDLTRIGATRTERDLLEAIVFPSASFVRSYEPTTIATNAGKVISGLVRKESADEVVVIVSADQEVRIDRKEIEEIKPGTVSVMPSGLDQQLSTRELADLVAFLKACQ